MSEQITFIRQPDVQRRSGLRKSSLYRRMQAGLFPKPISLSERSVGWREDVIDDYNRLIASGASEEAIRAFVKSLSPEENPKPKRARRGAQERVRARA
jgi:prophage regulatory protein